MTSYQDQKRWKNWIYTPGSIYHADDPGGAFVFCGVELRRWMERPDFLAPRCFWERDAAFSKKKMTAAALDSGSVYTL